MSAVIGKRVGINSQETFDLDKLRVNLQHSVVFVVQMTDGVGLAGSPDEDARENEVVLVPGIPAIGAASDIAAGAYCISRTCTEIGPATWEVECVFDNQTIKANESNQEPWDITPRWSWSAETIEVPLLFDAQDPTRPFYNSAGESLPPLTTPETIQVLTITRAELYFDYTQIPNYMNRVNSQGFWGAAANTVLCASISATQERKEQVAYWNVEYQFKFWSNNGEGWKIKLLDEGTYYWSGGSKGTGAKVPFGDDAFQQTTGNLNGSGGKNTSLTTPVFISPSFNRYKSANFNDLQLGPWSWA
jgi:hypothetical protein